MPKLLIKPKKRAGKIISVTPKSAKWKYVGHDVWNLAKGKSAKGMESQARNLPCFHFWQGPRDS